MTLPDSKPGIDEPIESEQAHKPDRNEEVMKEDMAVQDTLATQGPEDLSHMVVPNTFGDVPKI
jgi:hypothetical protein